MTLFCGQGTTDKKGECITCKGKLADCGGHYGESCTKLSTSDASLTQAAAPPVTQATYGWSCLYFTSAT